VSPVLVSFITKPALPKATHALDHSNEVMALLGQGIFYARRDFRKCLSDDDPLFFQRA
jgi:hypothetical protein